MKKNDREKDGMKDKGRDVPASPDLLNFPWGPTAGAVPPTGPIETSSDSRATEGGEGWSARPDCGNCPSCLITKYLDAHDHIVTEVVHIAEGVWVGPDEYSFNPETHEVLGDLHDGIGVMAIEVDNGEAQAWWQGQKMLALMAAFGLLDEV